MEFALAEMSVGNSSSNSVEVLQKRRTSPFGYHLHRLILSADRASGSGSGLVSFVVLHGYEPSAPADRQAVYGYSNLLAVGPTHDQQAVVIDVDKRIVGPLWGLVFNNVGATLDDVVVGVYYDLVRLAPLEWAQLAAVEPS